MTKKQTTQDNIFYFQEVSQDILNLSLRFSYQEIGFYLTFKAAYIFHKGKIPFSRINQFCRIFNDQEKFKNFVQNNFKIEDDFIISESFNAEIDFITKKSDERKKAAESRWKNPNEDAIAYPNEDAIGDAKQETINIKQETLTKKLKTRNKIFSPDVEKLTEGLKFVLEAKLNRKLQTNSWQEEIRKLVEIDLKERANAVDDVKKAIQEISNRFGEQYFPVIQSAGSLREKFSKIEAAIQRNQSAQQTPANPKPNPVKEFNKFMGEEFANRILEDSEGVKVFLRSRTFEIQINSDSELKNKINGYFKNKKWELICQ